MRLDERLRHAPPVIMDGGVATEIQRRGHAMDRQAWSATAHMTDPDAVQAIHESYIRAGAEIVTANTFATSRVVLEAAGLGDQLAAINRRAVEVAAAARDEAAAAPVWIAGSISSMAPLTALSSTARGEGIEDGYRRQAEILAAAGADLLIAEMMVDLEGAAPVVRAAAGAGLPLWVGFSATLADDGTVVGYRSERDNDRVPQVAFGDLVDGVLALGGDVAGVMHSAVPVTAPALEILAARWDGPTMAYAETGWFANPDWVFTEAVSPDAYATAVAGWVAGQGVRIVGGCCGTGPDHIRALKARL